MAPDTSCLLMDADAIAKAAPVAQVLSNGRYTVLITAAGTGYSSYDGIALTRWVPDRTHDVAGFFLYVKDLITGSLWSASLLPLPPDGEYYTASFMPGAAEFLREVDGLETLLEICVAPDDDVELRRITLMNHADMPRSVQLTTYAEVVLNTPAADAGHPAFSKLFVQTELAPDGTGLVAKRRPRSQEERPLWLEHRFWQVDGPLDDQSEWETDRARFIGRGRTLANPQALDAGIGLSGTTGSVLDPVFAIRRDVIVPPGKTVRLVAILATSDTLDGLDTLSRRYSERTNDVDPIDAVNAAFAAAAERGSQLYAELGLPDDEDPDGEQTRMLHIASTIGAITYGDGINPPLALSIAEPIDDRTLLAAAVDHE